MKNTFDVQKYVKIQSCSHYMIVELYTATYLVTFHFTKHFNSLIVNISRNCQKNQHVIQESGMGNVRDLRWLHINCTMNFTNFQTLKADHKGMPTSTKVSNPKTGPLEIFAGQLIHYYFKDLLAGASSFGLF